jgi:hypothetical protein
MCSETIFSSSCVIYHKSHDKIICVSSSNADQYATCKNWINPFVENLPAHSAILEAIEIQDLLIWEIIEYFSPSGNFLVRRYTSLVNFLDFCHTDRSLKLCILIAIKNKSYDLTTYHSLLTTYYSLLTTSFYILQAFPDRYIVSSPKG